MNAMALGHVRDPYGPLCNFWRWTKDMWNKVPLMSTSNSVISNTVMLFSIQYV